MRKQAFILQYVLNRAIAVSIGFDAEYAAVVGSDVYDEVVDSLCPEPKEHKEDSQQQ